jgi:hypothetical protein
VGFFVIVYPLAGLLTEATHRHSFDSLLQVALIIYLFGISRGVPASPDEPCQEPA